MKKQIEGMRNDLIEIFDEEYSKRSLITPQNTAEKLTYKGYRKASEVAREIFEEIDKRLDAITIVMGRLDSLRTFHKTMEKVTAEMDELKKKYTEDGE